VVYSAITAPTQHLEMGDITFAYRSWGKAEGRPVVFLNHLAANLDNWDPHMMDLIAEERTVVTVDNRGVGASTGEVPTTIEGMADDAAVFLRGLSSSPIDLVGLSMGGMVAQELVLRHPDLVNKLVLVGTGPRGGEGIEKVTFTTVLSIVKALFTRSDPKEFIFFGRNASGKSAARAYIARLAMRTVDRDTPVTISAFRAQLKAIRAYAAPVPLALGHITHRTLVVNGDNDIMVPTPLSYVLAENIPSAELEIYPDSGHGSLFQYGEHFARRVLAFLTQ
jgi:pimeloyl-ACP methyl ester carboxylesterase